MCLACLFRLMDLRTRYTHVFSALASRRSASWAKLIMDETRGYHFYEGYEEDLQRGFQKFAAYWRTIVVGAF